MTKLSYDTYSKELDEYIENRSCISSTLSAENLTKEYEELNKIFNYSFSDKETVESMESLFSYKLIVYKIRTKNYTNSAITDSICITSNNKPLFYMSNNIYTSDDASYTNSVFINYKEDCRIDNKLVISKTEVEGISLENYDLLTRGYISNTEYEYIKKKYGFCYDLDKLSIYTENNINYDINQLRVEDAYQLIEKVSNAIDSAFNHILQKEVVKEYIIRRKVNNN